MESSILVLIGVLVIAYIWIYHVNVSKLEGMSVMRYRPLMTGMPASIGYDDNIAGIPDYNSTVQYPNVNQYANDLAFNENNVNSAHHMLQGRSITNMPAYQYFGDRDGEVAGRN
ncbi:MAG: hypothetical protein Gaeavirus24_7 [Gaeavirus sp.]|uniref:Uncharacterized protein n=1 Tax=Gaeavirus sp. TaxID=2487767 RepID=A0A3G5A481_9VIRU|nr:MAG: hypothetical protein Gaeavirus24_7 [Gaeavirus sp.]